MKQLPLVEVTAEHKRGEYVFKPGSGGDWVHRPADLNAGGISQELEQVDSNPRHLRRNGGEGIGFVGAGVGSDLVVRPRDY